MGVGGWVACGGGVWGAKGGVKIAAPLKKKYEQMNKVSFAPDLTESVCPKTPFVPNNPSHTAGHLHFRMELT